jgi:hypothetical protein
MGRLASLEAKRFLTTERHDELQALASAEKSPPSRRSHWAGATRLALALVFVGSVACTTPARAEGSRGVLVSRGPWIDRTLMGGIARDLSIHELRAVNRARGVTLGR